MCPWHKEAPGIGSERSCSPSISANSVDLTSRPGCAVRGPSQQPTETTSDADGFPRPRLRLDRHRLRLRRQRVRAAAGGEGHIGSRCSSAAHGSRTTTSPRRPRTPSATTGCRTWGEGDPPADAVQGHLHRLGLRRRRRQPRIREHALPPAAGVLRQPAVVGAGRLGSNELAPHYDTAERMLGVTEYDTEGPADLLLKEYGESIGVGDTFQRTRGSASSSASPARRCQTRTSAARGPSGRAASSAARAWSAAATAPRTPCARTTSGSRSELGVEIQPERTVIDVAPLNGSDGRDGYAVTSVRSGAWVVARSRRCGAGGVVVAAGALGTNRLLQRCKLNGSLPEDLRPARPSGPDQQRVEHGRDRADRTTQTTSRSRSRITSSIYTRRRHPHRGRHLGSGRRLAVAAVRDDRRGGQARDATAPLPRQRRSPAPRAASSGRGSATRRGARSSCS